MQYIAIQKAVEALRPFYLIVRDTGLDKDIVWKLIRKERNKIQRRFMEDRRYDAIHMLKSQRPLIEIIGQTGFTAGHLKKLVLKEGISGYDARDFYYGTRLSYNYNHYDIWEILFQGGNPLEDPRVKYQPNSVRGYIRAWAYFYPEVKQTAYFKDRPKYIRPSTIAKRKILKKGFKKLYNKGHNDTAIAKLLGVGTSDVYWYRKGLELPPNIRNFSDENKRKIEELYIAGEKISIIAEKTKLNCSTVAKHIRSLAIKRVPIYDNRDMNREEAESYLNMRLTMEETAAEIGCSYNHWYKIMKKYDLKPDYYSRILKHDYSYIRKLYDEGMIDAEISRTVNIDPALLTRWRKKLGLPKNIKKEDRKSIHKAPHPNSARAQREIRYWHCYKLCMRDQDIARVVGVTTQAVRAWRKRKDLQKHSPMKGIKHHYQDAKKNM